MANLDFYALKADLVSVLSFIYNETDIVIYESYSEHDRDLRCFTTLADLESTLEIGKCPKGQTPLQLWSPSVIQEPKPRRIELKVKGSSFRYSVEAVGLIQLYLGGWKDNEIVESHYGHWSQAGAEQRSTLPTDACNWNALKKLSGRLQRFIRGMAAAKLHSRVILPTAFSEIKRGKQIHFLNQIFDGQSKEIVPLREKVS